MNGIRPGGDLFLSWPIFARSRATPCFLPPGHGAPPDPSCPGLDQIVAGPRRAETSRDAFYSKLWLRKDDEEHRLWIAFQGKVVGIKELLAALSALAEACFREAFLFEKEELQKVHGIPSSPFHVLAAGKLGGGELTYHSDLDLLFVVNHDGETTGPQKISNSDFYIRLVQHLIYGLGGIYVIDLRLWGRSDTLVTSWRAFEDYYRRHARVWEKMALLRARVLPIAPTAASGIPEDLGNFIWNWSYERSALAREMHTMREQMDRDEGSHSHRNLKTGRGGILEIEQMVQFLQLLHGGGRPGLRSPNTLTALRALSAGAILPRETAGVLEDAYLFYRSLETVLRYLSGRFTCTLPNEGEIMAGLAETMGETSLASLLARYDTTREEVRRIYLEILGLG